MLIYLNDSGILLTIMNFYPGNFASIRVYLPKGGHNPNSLSFIIILLFFSKEPLVFQTLAHPPMGHQTIGSSHTNRDTLLFPL